MNSFRTWWQIKTGEDETPLDGDAPAWFISLVVHMILFIVLGLMGYTITVRQDILLSAVEEVPEEEVEIMPEFAYSSEDSPTVGSDHREGFESSLSEAAALDDESYLPTPEIERVEESPVPIFDDVAQATGLVLNSDVAVRGQVGVGATGATGAIDRITEEIKLSLERRSTLVIWLFDESYSLNRQRQEVNARFDKIYRELGEIDASGHKAFKKHRDRGDIPLLTSVISFGQRTTPRTKGPTDSLDEIKSAVESIVNDPTGDENVFSSIYGAVTKYLPMRTREKRNVMVVVFTDEVGDDQIKGLDPTIDLCRKNAVPVYVVGVPAPFGRQKTLVKWVDPDPAYDQTPRWGEVVQGPESFQPERVKLSFGPGVKDEPIDSGFGPYALTRLCYETGGIYFAVHPNRTVNRTVSRGETEVLASHLTRFFDPNIMQNYRPDYVTIDEYRELLKKNKAREALVRASHASWTHQLGHPQLRFPKKNEADLANRLTEAQKVAARLEPEIRALHDILRVGEEDRNDEIKPRWKAGYDLAMGRVLAAKVRTEGYNAMLAKAKGGLKFKDTENDTWQLQQTDEISVGSALAKDAKLARQYLTRVINEHEGTPWALLAKRELERPMGWTWEERYTNVNRVRRGGGGGGGNNAPPRNDKKRVLPKRKPSRKVPRL